MDIPESFLKNLVIKNISRKMRERKNKVERERTVTLADKLFFEFCRSVLLKTTKNPEFKMFWDLTIPGKDNNRLFTWIEVLDLLNQTNSIRVFISSLELLLSKGDGVSTGCLSKGYIKTGTFAPLGGSEEVLKSVMEVLEDVSSRL